MGNPFEDLRQAVVVRPMNSPGPQGAAAPEMKIQYSYDGQSWHDDPVDTDRYLRFSTDNGISWSDAIYFNNLYETLAWVDKARRWAINPEDLAVEPGKYSALHYASKAENAAINAATDAAEAANELIEPSIEKARQWAENPENNPVIYPDQYSALHHATKAARSAANAEAAALDAAGSAVKAFGAAAPAWDNETIYNYNDVVSFDNGHTYRCIGINIVGEDHAPNINGKDNEEEWTRITVAPDGFFELDEYGNLMPRLTPLVSELFTLDENGDIMHKDPIDIEFGDGELYPVSGKLEFINSIHDFRNASFASTTENVYLNGYYGAGTPGGGMFYRDSESTEADNSGTIIVDGDGIRWKRANVYEEYYASWFGVSTDIDDNSPLIQNALEVIPTDSTLIFGPGLFKCKQTIVFPDHRRDFSVKEIVLQGAVQRTGNSAWTETGTRLKYDGPSSGTPTPFFDFRGSTGDKKFTSAIRHIMFEGPSRPNNIIGLSFWDAYGSKIESSTFFGFEKGIEVNRFFYNTKINDVYCGWCDHGIVIHGSSSNATFTQCDFTSNGIGVLSDVGGLNFNNCSFENNMFGLKITLKTLIRISQCHFESNSQYHIDCICQEIDWNPLLILKDCYFCHGNNDIILNRSIIKLTLAEDVTATCVIDNNIIHQSPTMGNLDYFIYVIDGDIIIKAENNLPYKATETPFLPCSKTPLESSYFNNKCFII